MYGKIKEHLQNRLQTIEDSGIFKRKESSLRLKELKLLFLLETVLNFALITIWDYHHIQR
jgi:glycine C-acetyltransferase